MRGDLERPGVPRRLFVLPQHLELRDGYHEARLHENLRMVAPERWGVARLAIGTEAFSRGILRITDLLVRFESGELATLPLGAPPLELGVAPQVLAAGARDVWVGMEDGSDGPNASVEPSASTRYVRLGGLRADERPVLRPRLRLYLEGRDTLPTDRVRLARIRGVGDGIELDPEVVPPMLWPLGGTWVPRAIATVLGSLTARQEELLAARRERPHEPTTFSATQVPQLFALSRINEAIARLSSATSERGLSLDEVHDVFAELLGTIEATEGRLLSIPTYRHEDPGPGLRVLLGRLSEKVALFGRLPHDAFLFERKDAQTFRLRLPDVARLRRPLYLVVSGAEPAWLEQNVPAYAKLASDVGLERIRQTATRGVELAFDFDPPSSLPTGDSATFRMNVRSDHWRDVEAQRSLAFYLPNASATLKVTLYVLRPPA